MNRAGADETQHTLREKAKHALRKRMKAIRGTLPQSAGQAQSREIHERVVGLPEFERAKTVVLFSSKGNEVQTTSMMEAAWCAAKRVALPRVIGATLQLYQVDTRTELVEGAFGVLEPTELARSTPPQEVDFAVVPALAVDRRGYRVGYGGGYFDRLLPHLANAATCVVAFDFQLVEEVPVQHVDVPVDIVVTDQRVLRAHKTSHDQRR